MPTGYTAGVGDGTVTEFAEYALGCAKAFGACIEMRDEPHDAQIPDAFEPSTYHAEQLAVAEADLAAIKSSTDAEIQTVADGWYSGERIRYDDRLAETRTTRARYEAMLAKARAFTSPSADHDNYKAFLCSQLDDSIKWDCNEEHATEPTEKTAAEWRADRIAELTHSIAYHTEHHAADVKRAEERTQWVAQLRAALKQ